MLKTHGTDFLAYCKVVDFSDKSIESFSVILKKFIAFAVTKQVDHIEDITYGHLSDFVADFNEPSIHKKKVRVWCLHLFFHYLTVTNHLKKNLVLGLPYPEIEKTVPHYLTIKEFERIIEFFSARISSDNGLRNLVLILILGILGLRTGTIVALNVEHIDTDDSLAWISEKVRRQRQIVLPEVLANLLKIYISRLDLNIGPLFLSIRKKRISPRVLQDIFRNATGSLGIEKQLHGRFFVTLPPPISTRLQAPPSPRRFLVMNAASIL